MIASIAMLLACHAPVSDTAGGGTPNTCPRDGTVLADARDVEREAEGIATTAFGEGPKHEPDFTRAQGILALLERVWSGAKTACPDLPGEVVTGINDAVTQLQADVPAQDQRGTTYAGNDIHLLTSPLFAYVNRPKPVQLEEMDALFLRVGLDAWYGAWTSYDANIVTIQADWATVKPVVDSLTPTCHRVAGTASVSGDIDQTIAALQKAHAASDVDAAQVGSQDGLSEVDIIEQLFDCPPDGETPGTGLGAACATTAECGDSSLVCDLDNAGGRCAPDPATTNVGAACTTTVDCGSDERDACNHQVGDGYPGGYCTMEPCNDVQVCSPGATCVAMPFETPACMQSCVQDSDCRTREGYVCQLFPTTPPDGYGPSDHACAFACTQDTDCTGSLTCNVTSGKCTP